MKKKFSLVIIIMVCTLLFIPSSYASYHYRWRDIEEWAGHINASATVIKIEFTSLYRNKYLSEDQFELYDNIMYVRIYLLDSTSNISIEKISIISPIGDKRDINMRDGGYYIYKNKKIPVYTSLYYEISPENPLIFNETGIWTIEVQTNSSTYISKYEGDIRDFNKNSEARNFFGNRIGIEVLSPTAVQQLATAIETKNLVEWQKWMVFVTACMVVITAIAMVVNANTNKKLIEEIAKHLIEIEKIMERLEKNE